MAFNLDTLLSNNSAEVSPDGTRSIIRFNGEVIDLGNGYTQTVVQGINRSTEELTITLTLLEGTELTNVFTGLRNNLGGEVTYTSPDASTATDWLLLSVEKSRFLTGGHRTINFSLRQLHT